MGRWWIPRSRKCGETWGTRLPPINLMYCGLMWTDLIKCLEESTVVSPRIEEAITLKNKKLPTHIYKYRSDTAEARENLRSDTIWMASPETYNDPYDSWLMFPCGTLLTLLESNLVDKLVEATKLAGIISQQQIADAKKSPEPLKAVVEHVQRVKTPEAFQYWDEKARSYSNQLLGYAQNTVSQLTGFRKKEKVCCFSANNDSLLMWSHYADQHKGFCIEYRIETLNSDHFFRKNLYPVLYSDEFYDLRFFIEGLTSYAAGSHQQFRPMIPLLAMLHKFKGWAYEKEWRLIQETDNIVPDRPQTTPTPSKIFLGARFDLSKGKELLEICQHKEIPTFQMRMAEDRFNISPQALV